MIILSVVRKTSATHWGGVEEMTHGGFTKVENTDEKMYGPRALMVCGYPPGEHSAVAGFVSRLIGPDMPVIFASDDMVHQRLGEILSMAAGTGMGTGSALSRGMILSGFTMKELHMLMAAYKEARLPRQLWATLTPVSEKWCLTDLMDELIKESEALKKT
jgi:hypothetical protein